MKRIFITLFNVSVFGCIIFNAINFFSSADYHQGLLWIVCGMLYGSNLSLIWKNEKKDGIINRCAAEKDRLFKEQNLVIAGWIAKWDDRTVENEKLKIEIKDVRAENLEWIDKCNELSESNEWLKAGCATQERSLEILKKQLIDRDRELKISKEALEALNQLATEDEKSLKEEIAEIKKEKAFHEADARFKKKELAKKEKEMTEVKDVRKLNTDLKKHIKIQEKVINQLKDEVENLKPRRKIISNRDAKMIDSIMCPRCRKGFPVHEKVTVAGKYSFICKECSKKIGEEMNK